MAEDQGSADESVPVDPAVRPPYITEHAADAVVKVVCLASAGTSRDRQMRKEMFELCLGIPGHGEATAARTGAAATAGRQNLSRAAVEALSR